MRSPNQKRSPNAASGSKRPTPARGGGGSRPTQSQRPAPAKEASRRPVRWSEELESAEAWQHDSQIGPADPGEVEEPLFDEPEPIALAEEVEETEDEEEDEEATPSDEEEGGAAAGADGDKGRGRRRSKTIARKQMLRERRRMLAQGTIPEIVDYERPAHRMECRDAERPCLFVSCRYHLYLDVNPVTGSIKLNFPDKEVWELSETCALDVAERGGITLEEVGDIMNLTRERIRQVEVSGLGKLKRGDASLETFVDGRELAAYPFIKGAAAPSAPASAEEDDDDDS